MISKVTHSFFFLANHPALDFLNTLPVVNGAPIDRLTDYRALVAWAEQAGLVQAEDAEVARARWADTPEAAAVVERARALRELYRTILERFRTGDTGHGLPPELLTQLNAALREESGAFAELRPDAKSGSLERITRLSMSTANDLLAPILRSMSVLFTEVDLRLVRTCENPTCVLVFYDVSKNHARRWCSMDACGNRHKVSAYRARK